MVEGRSVLVAMLVALGLAGCGDEHDGHEVASTTGGMTATAPAAPTSVTVAPLGLGLHVTWMDASDDEDNFVIERHDGGGDFEEVFELPFDSNTYHDEGTLVSGTEYTYRIGAINTAGTSYSDEVTATAP